MSPRPKRYFKSYKQKWTLKNCWANKFSKGTIIAIHFSLLQVCLSLAHFVLAVFLIFSFHVLTVYVYLSLSLMAVNYHCLKFVKSWRSSINTVVHFWQSFIEKLGLQETGNKQTNVLLVTWYFIFIALHAWLWIVIVGSGRSTQNKMGKRNIDYQNIEKEVRDGTVGGYM